MRLLATAAPVVALAALLGGYATTPSTPITSAASAGTLDNNGNGILDNNGNG
ncbi:hypothetical protein [Kineosporia sp. NBRC 101731]|uniref:hypothetical protein n=1 Tax=Kineosporia sp. NBRC 101731 TaxID=3032199 RepID=UPI0024A011C4|nr:hypothetical protein [Kineosporia sp. NBRC 101731]GLY28379.1 hypothetical protein Kisp02_17440 [Kineosporia sp. NBRC 101731]